MIPTYEEDADRYRHLEANRVAIVEEQDAIKARMRGGFGLGKHLFTGGGSVTLSPNRRFDPGLAQQTLGYAIADGIVTPDQVKACWKPSALDSTEVKRILPPERYEACMASVGDPKVSIS